MFVPTIKYKRVSESKCASDLGDGNHVNHNQTQSQTQTQAARAGQSDLSSNRHDSVLDENSVDKNKTIKEPDSTYSSLKDDSSGFSTSSVQQSIEVHPTDDESLIITLSNGKKYTTDRYCPHAGADLSLHGKVSEDEYGPEFGPLLMCSIHYWEFALDRKGLSGSGRATINACPVPCSNATKKFDW